MSMSAHELIDIWDAEYDRIGHLEDNLDEAIDRMIEKRPAEFRKRLTEEDFKTATKTYIGFIELTGALRGALREMRSVKTRFPGQIADPESAAAQLYSTADHVAKAIHSFVDSYSNNR